MSDLAATNAEKTSENSQESSLGRVLTNLNPIDLAEGFYKGALKRPVDSVRQILGAEIDIQASKSPETLSGKAGYMVGQIADFALLAVASKGALKPLMGKAIERSSGAAATMFTAGAVDSGLLTPTKDSRSMWQDRFDSAVINGSTFAIMGGTNKALEAKKFFSNNLLDQSLKAGTSGALSGAAHSYTETYLKEGRLASGSEVLNNSAYYALFGAGLHATFVGAGKLAQQPQLRDAYYSSKWRIGEAIDETQKLSWAALNKVGMRHPLHSLGHLVYGKPEVAVPPKVSVTAENNPITRFERELPRYFKEVSEGEKRYQNAARGTDERQQAWNEMGETQAQFLEKMLGVWFGKPATRTSPAQPGLISYTDAELTAGGHSLQRIAAVREALSQPMNRQSFTQLSPFEESMIKLAKQGDELDHHALEMARGLGKARERSCQYDEAELGKNLGLNTVHHHVARSSLTAPDWMPYEATATLANLFHTTTSKALPGILSERALLPATELRRRGIGQVAGESSNEEMGRRVISMTRSFPESFCYHRHSVEQLINFPVVFGISKDVTARAFRVFAEPGELAIAKLNMGKSISQRLGLSKPDITHVYVPDSQAELIAQTLNNYRVRGVNVVGFNQMGKPKWNEENIEELIKRGY